MDQLPVVPGPAPTLVKERFRGRDVLITLAGDWIMFDRLGAPQHCHAKAVDCHMKSSPCSRGSAKGQRLASRRRSGLARSRASLGAPVSSDERRSVIDIGGGVRIPSLGLGRCSGTGGRCGLDGWRRHGRRGRAKGIRSLRVLGYEIPFIRLRRGACHRRRIGAPVLPVGKRERQNKSRGSQAA